MRCFSVEDFEEFFTENASAICQFSKKKLAAKFFLK